MATKEPPLQVLLVDDNPGDVLLMQETFEELHVGVDVILAADVQIRAAGLPTAVCVPRRRGVERGTTPRLT